MDTSSPFPEIDDTLLATARYLQALTVLDERALAEPSVLPGWSRAHVVAHVSRNADAFTRVLDQAGAGEAASMYDSSDARDHDIAATVERYDAPRLLRDAEESSRRLERALRVCDGDRASSYARVAGDEPVFRLTTVVPRRRAEVEIHHSDLDVGYEPSSWPTDFSAHVVWQRLQESAHEELPSMVLSSTDVPGLWKFGAGRGPEIQGAVGDLAWWLVGRGGGRGLTCSAGTLPQLGRWR